MLGKPQSDLLSTHEEELCAKAGISIPDSTNVLTYSGLAVSNSVVTSVSRSQTTKRDNSCVMVEGEERGWGLVQKVFSLKGAEPPLYYCLLSLLSPANEQVCHDTLTNARIEKHLVACEPR